MALFDTITTICDKSEECNILTCEFHNKRQRPLEKVGTNCCTWYRDARLKALCETTSDIFTWDFKNDEVCRPSYRDDINTIRSVLETLGDQAALDAFERIK